MQYTGGLDDYRIPFAELAGGFVILTSLRLATCS